ncbi:MAG: TIGR02466 family protein [Hyphomicrobiaceae bacterium]
MATIERLFVTKLYREELSGPGTRRLNEDLLQSCRFLAEEDGAGRAWCEKNNYPGYTSYASLTDIALRAPAFADLIGRLDGHVAEFAAALDLDIGRRRLACDSIWVNVLEPGGFHASHIHPHSVVSGTYYVSVPKGASALKLEDPRLGFMMAAPPRRARADLENRQFVYQEPKAGTLILWESWLRHEVPMNMADRERISVSFNYGLERTED